MKYLFLSALSILSWLSFNHPNLTKDFLEKTSKQDVSHLWVLTEFNIENDTFIIKRPQPLGYIGDNYQRFHIHMNSIFPNHDNPLKYFVSGKTKVKDNISSFMGTMEITDSQIYEEGDITNIEQGYIIGEYNFYEDPAQSGAGTLKGTFRTNFYLDSTGTFQYDALMFIADGFSNNQFEGTWESYRTKVIKKCNWGDFRIPDSRQLDIGAGEFSPDPNYKKYGWLNYILSQDFSDKNKLFEAQKIENSAWWE